MFLSEGIQKFLFRSALRQIVSKHKLAALGEDFEKQEHTLFGEDVEAMVDRVARIEKALGIYDLAQFTP